MPSFLFFTGQVNINSPYGYMPVSIVNNLSELSPTLLKQIQLETKTILSAKNDSYYNRTAFQSYFDRIFKKGNSEYISTYAKWGGSEVVLEALKNFGSLNSESELAFHLAENFPSILLYTAEDFSLTWEFLHYLGNNGKLKTNDLLISFLYSLPKHELVSWASWISPSLNLHDKNKLIEFIYTFSRNFNFRFDFDFTSLKKNISLAKILENSNPKLKWIAENSPSFFTFLRKWDELEDSPYPKLIKYGLLILLSKGKSKNTTGINYKDKLNSILQMPKEFEKLVLPERKTRSADLA